MVTQQRKNRCISNGFLCFLKKYAFQEFVSLLFLLSGKMFFPELFITVGIVKLVLKLFTCQIECMSIHDVETMEIAVMQRDPEDLTAADILYQKGCNGTLSERLVFITPVFSHSGRARLCTPGLSQDVVQVSL